MHLASTLTLRRALLVFLVSTAGAVVGVVAGPRIVAAFEAAPSWLLPAVLMICMIVALIAAYAALRLATGRRHDGRVGRDPER